MAVNRISLTLPTNTLIAIDRRARAGQRDRSGAVTRCVERYSALAHLLRARLELDETQWAVLEKHLGDVSADNMGNLPEVVRSVAERVGGLDGACLHQTATELARLPRIHMVAVLDVLDCRRAGCG